MEDLEQILRRIHILFSKCEAYGKESDDKIIVPKKEVFRLLEKLNYAVVHLMDEYEGTQESRERGIKNFYEEGEKIKAAAQNGAEDVYAASLIYTDNMLEELNDVLASAKEELWEQYARMAHRLDRQAKVLSEDQEEIQQQLGAMAQSGKYLKLIERENERLKREQERAQMEMEWEEEEEEESTQEEDGEEESADEEDTDKADKDREEDTPDNEEEPSAKDKKELPEDQEKKEERKPEKGDGAITTPVGRAASSKLRQPEKKKNGNGKRVSARQHARMSPDLEEEWAKEAAERKVRKIGTALYEDVGEAYDPPVKHVAYEVKVNPGYFSRSEEDSASLDAEYFKWQEEGEGAGKLSEKDAEDEEGDDMPTIQVLGKTGEEREDKKEKRKRGLKFGKHG